VNILNNNAAKIHKINKLRKFFFIQTAIPLIVYKKVKVKVKVIVKVKFIVKFIVKFKVIVKVFILLQSTQFSQILGVGWWN
jgi:hypothetical protein